MSCLSFFRRAHRYILPCFVSIELGKRDPVQRSHRVLSCAARAVRTKTESYTTTITTAWMFLVFIFIPPFCYLQSWETFFLEVLLAFVDLLPAPIAGLYVRAVSGEAGSVIWHALLRMRILDPTDFHKCLYLIARSVFVHAGRYAPWVPASGFSNPPPRK